MIGQDRCNPLLLKLLPLLACSVAGLEAQAQDDTSSRRESRLICHFRFDDGKGAKVHDCSPNALTGEISAAVQGKDVWAKGVHGLALAFDKDWGASHLVIQKTEMLDIARELTICFWLKPSRDSKSAFVINRGLSPTAKLKTGFRVQYFWQNLRVYLGFGDGRKALVTRNRPPPHGPWVPYGHWRHIAITFDGRHAKVYVNAKEAASLGLREEQTLAPNSNRLRLSTPRHNRFTGLLDDLRIYHVALTEKQIRKVAADE